MSKKSQLWMWIIITLTVTFGFGAYTAYLFFNREAVLTSISVGSLSLFVCLLPILMVRINAMELGEERGRGQAKRLDELAKDYPGRLFQVLTAFGETAFGDEDSKTYAYTSVIIESTEKDGTWYVSGEFPRVRVGDWVISRIDQKGKGYLVPIVLTNSIKKSSDQEEKSSAGGTADTMG
ncbi:MAG: hypothetical protein A2114_02570 [Candidatus Vogelbacteria bacterium GWA1_51_14]|uniref:Uncharacterized protein n=1 Tax=Candidatus Vogelbacteria bacterium GWA1_51_14 TaxID=1802435 RepID=A0A1G2QB73_9BACT|nr:MAG: hypothetical protein A2114_02570 [Candidatus Vogelbacteria bacterium GWA1_51_14]